MPPEDAPHLGALVPANEFRRDAIHVAVAPVVAGSPMMPGDHCRMVDWQTAYPCVSGKGVGVADPYLVGSIDTGDRFWLLLYPNTVTGMRHAWTHPAFIPPPQ